MSGLLIACSRVPGWSTVRQMSHVHLQGDPSDDPLKICQNMRVISIPHVTNLGGKNDPDKWSTLYSRQYLQGDYVGVPPELRKCKVLSILHLTNLRGGKLTSWINHPVLTQAPAALNPRIESITKHLPKSSEHWVQNVLHLTNLRSATS